jgi:hypothetical protein
MYDVRFVCILPLNAVFRKRVSPASPLRISSESMSAAAEADAAATSTRQRRRSSYTTGENSESMLPSGRYGLKKSLRTASWLLGAHMLQRHCASANASVSIAA